MEQNSNLWEQGTHILVKRIPCTFWCNVKWSAVFTVSYMKDKVEGICPYA